MTDYKMLESQAAALLRDEEDGLASAANFVALLYNALDDVNWLGIYVLRGDGRATQRVPDVHAFPGHIVCDAASRSEIVVPLVVDDTLVGVLDIDSPSLDRFSREDQDGIERLCATFCRLRSGRGFL